MRSLYLWCSKFQLTLVSRGLLLGSLTVLPAAVLLCAWLWLGWSQSQPTGEDKHLSAQARLGQLVFHDTSLSASGQQSCASCHLKELGHASARGLEIGGQQMQFTGDRNTPSLRYLWRNTGLHIDEEGKASGGYFWDGRADSLKSQAAEPFLNPVEMANVDKASVVAKLSRTAYAAEFERVFGTDIWQQTDKAFGAMTQALASYQTEDINFHPFDSVFDRVSQGQASFNAAQARGWELFKDPEKGNCAACHTAEADKDGTPPLFTDNSYDNLGVPATAKMLKNQTLDKGVCTHPLVRARPDAQKLCGAFKVPSLRNVAVRRAFFHNAAMTDLREVIAFYATRDTDPKRWYGTTDTLGGVPKALRANVNRDEVPYGQKPGEQPRLDEQEIDDLLAFLLTLTDADLAGSVAKPRTATAAPAVAARASPPVANPKAANSL
jgi:cytochrome c peroxidase